jgi:hypothetical protein
MAWGAQVIPPPAKLRDPVLGRPRVAQRRWRPQFLVLGCPLTQAMSYVVKGRQRRDRWGAEIWTSDRQRSLTPRKLALLHKVIAAYATEHQTRMQCVAELPRASLLSPSKGAYSAQSLRPEKAA